MASIRLVVEYDGSVSHRAPARGRVDAAKTAALLDAGYRVVRVREHPLPPLDLSHLLLHQISHTWGDPVEHLAQRIVDIVE